jgi:hypothetical protein
MNLDPTTSPSRLDSQGDNSTTKQADHHLPERSKRVTSPERVAAPCPARGDLRRAPTPSASYRRPPPVEARSLFRLRLRSLLPFPPLGIMKEALLRSAKRLPRRVGAQPIRALGNVKRQWFARRPCGPSGPPLLKSKLDEVLSIRRGRLPQMPRKVRAKESIAPDPLA